MPLEEAVAQTKDLQQQGFCESCFQPAFSIRHSEGIELYKDAQGVWHSKPYQIEHPMCIYHKGKYIRFMDEKRKELEKRRYGKNYGNPR